MASSPWAGAAPPAWQRYDRLAPALRPGDAAGAVGPYRGLASISRSRSAGLAFDHLSALFRRRGDLSGFAMVLTLAIPIRKIYGLKDFITVRHLDNMAKVMLGHRFVRHLRLSHRSIHGLVFGRAG